MRRFLLIFGFCFVSFNLLANEDADLFSEKVNLALRRTAHSIRIENGDSLSTIPGVRQLDLNTFVVQIDRLFDYDQLPLLLQSSLDLHGIKRSYHVAILNCDNGEIQLGYSFKDLMTKDGVPCAGRKQEPGCYELKVSFSPETKETSASSNWWILPIGSLLAGLGFMVWRKAEKGHIMALDKAGPVVAVRPKIQFGSSELDVANLLLHSGTSQHTLTYREAKLLNLFVNHKNQILERDFILKSVWEDEGIIVGRSVDVFVSRLRKLLQNDLHIKITAVHGIGYRMEVSS